LLGRAIDTDSPDSRLERALARKNLEKLPEIRAWTLLAGMAWLSQEVGWCHGRRLSGGGRPKVGNSLDWSDDYMGRKWSPVPTRFGVFDGQVAADGCRCPEWLRVAYRETGYVHKVPLDCVLEEEDGVLVLEGILRGRRRT